MLWGRPRACRPPHARQSQLRTMPVAPGEAARQSQLACITPMTDCRPPLHCTCGALHVCHCCLFSSEPATALELEHTAAAAAAAALCILRGGSGTSQLADMRFVPVQACCGGQVLQNKGWPRRHSLQDHMDASGSTQLGLHPQHYCSGLCQAFLSALLRPASQGRSLPPWLVLGMADSRLVVAHQRPVGALARSRKVHAASQVGGISSACRRYSARHTAVSDEMFCQAVRCPVCRSKPSARQVSLTKGSRAAATKAHWRPGVPQAHHLVSTAVPVIMCRAPTCGSA